MCYHQKIFLVSAFFCTSAFLSFLPEWAYSHSCFPFIIFNMFLILRGRHFNLEDAPDILVSAELSGCDMIMWNCYARKNSRIIIGHMKHSVRNRTLLLQARLFLRYSDSPPSLPPLCRLWYCIHVERGDFVSEIKILPTYRKPKGATYLRSWFI